MVLFNDVVIPSLFPALNLYFVIYPETTRSLWFGIKSKSFDKEHDNSILRTIDLQTSLILQTVNQCPRYC